MSMLRRAALLLLPLSLACQRPEATARRSPQDSTPSLALAPLSGPRSSDPQDQEIARVQAVLRQGPQDADTWARLARAFVLKARSAGQPDLYNQAGDAAQRALQLKPEHPAALEVRQTVLLNAHRFAEARRLAQEILARRPRDVVAWGTLGDSALELGDYQAAAGAYQQMIDLKPDLRSYNRGAWLRWLSGDGDGAVELMTQAAAAGAGEPRAFCLTQLGDLHFLRGRYPEARAAYDEALSVHPRNPAALAARGRLSLSTGRTEEALADLSAALTALPLAATRISYIEALWAAKKDSQASEELARLKREGEREDPRAVALFYATHGIEPKRAVALAQQEAVARPDIFSADALAWALFRDGQIEEAWLAIQPATRLGTRDPRILYHRGQIAAARSPAVRGEAIETLKLALLQSPRWDRHEPDEARATLARLQGRP